MHLSYFLVAAAPFAAAWRPTYEPCNSTSANATTEVPYIRDYFYAGGQYVSDGANGTIFANQMYVEQLSPVGGATKPYPLVIIHGQAQTGTVRT